MAVRNVAVDKGWRLMATDLGLSTDRILRRAELPLDLFEREVGRLTVDEYLRLWKGFEDEADDPLLPLRVGSAISPELFNPPIFAAFCSPSLAVAIRRIAVYKRLCAPMRVTVEEDDRGLHIGWEWDDPSVESSLQFKAVELIFVIQLARIGTRRRVVPTRIVFNELPMPLAEYREFIGVTPEVGPVHGVSFSKEDAHAPFLTASEAMWATFEPELRRQLAELESKESVSERVRTVLLESLPSGEVGASEVAKRLGMSRRSLQRHLKAEGVSFRSLVQGVRERLSRHYLTTTNLEYGEIAFLLGFDETSSFFRAFRQWTGTTPQTLRLSMG